MKSINLILTFVLCPIFLLVIFVTPSNAQQCQYDKSKPEVCSSGLMYQINVAQKKLMSELNVNFYSLTNTPGNYSFQYNLNKMGDPIQCSGTYTTPYKSSFEYDSLDRMTKLIYTGNSKNDSYTETYTYNGDRLTEQKRLKKGKKTIVHITFEYDSEKQQITKNVNKGISELFDKIIYKIDKQNRLIATRSYLNGSLVMREDYIYNTKCQLISKATYLDNDSRASLEAYTYNDKGQIITVKTYTLSDMNATPPKKTETSSSKITYYDNGLFKAMEAKTSISQTFTTKYEYKFD